MTIIRDLEMNLSANKVGEMVQRLAICGGNIISFGAMHNGFKTTQVGRWQGFFTLGFPTEGAITFFHSCGYKTEEPEEIKGCTIGLDS